MKKGSIINDRATMKKSCLDRYNGKNIQKNKKSYNNPTRMFP